MVDIYTLLLRSTKVQPNLNNCMQQFEYIVTYRPTARQRLCTHIPVGANARNSRTYIARQWSSKHASLILETVIFVWSMQSGYKEVFSSTEYSRSCRELSRVLEMAVQDD
jgi:hypothetical protein